MNQRDLIGVQLAALILLGTACSGERAAPSAPLKKPEAMSSNVVLHDLQGTAVTVNPTTGIATDGSGYIFRLTPTMLERLFAAEDHSAGMIYLLDEYERYAGSPDTCTTNGTGVPCAESRMPQTGGASARASLPSTVRGGQRIVEVTPAIGADGNFVTRGFGRPIPAFGKWSRKSRPLPAGSAMMGRLPLGASLYEDWTCAGVTVALWAIREQVRANARSHVSGLLTDIRDAVVAGATAGTVFDFASAPAVGVGVEVAAAEVLSLYVQVSFLTGVARELQCQGVTRYGGSEPGAFFQPDPYSPPRGIWHRVCGMMLWDFRRENGTVESVWVETCLVQLEMFD